MSFGELAYHWMVDRTVAMFVFQVAALALGPGDIARLEAALTMNPGDMEVRTRLITHYFQHAMSQPRMRHIVWVVKNRPESKLAGSPVVRITPESNELSTRSDYEAVRALWLTNIERYARKAAVISNAARFFEAEEPARSADLYRRAWWLETDNKFRRADLIRFYKHILSACALPKPTCPDPTWLAGIRSEVERLTR